MITISTHSTTYLWWIHHPLTVPHTCGEYSIPHSTPYMRLVQSLTVPHTWGEYSIPPQYPISEVITTSPHSTPYLMWLQHPPLYHIHEVITTSPYCTPYLRWLQQVNTASPHPHSTPYLRWLQHPPPSTVPHIWGDYCIHPQYPISEMNTASPTVPPTWGEYSTPSLYPISEVNTTPPHCTPYLRWIQHPLTVPHTCAMYMYIST